MFGIIIDNIMVMALIMQLSFFIEKGYKQIHRYELQSQCVGQSKEFISLQVEIKQPEKEHIYIYVYTHTHICITESLFCILEAL